MSENKKRYISRLKQLALSVELCTFAPTIADAHRARANCFAMLLAGTAGRNVVFPAGSNNLTAGDEPTAAPL